MPLGESIGRAYVKVLADGSGFDQDLEEQIRAEAGGIEKAGKLTSKHYNKGFDDDNKKQTKRRLDELKTHLESLGRTFTKTGEAAGRLFGKGSRNDFLNVVGSMIGALPKLIGSLATAASKLKIFGADAEDAGKGVEGAGRSFEGLTSLLGPLIQAAIGAGVILTVVKSLGIFASALSLTTGLVLALAGSLGFALVGGIVAVGGAMIPLAAAIGTVALAMGGLNKESKAFKEVSKEFKSLQQLAAKKIFGKDGAGLSSLRDLLKAVRPLVGAVAGALGDVLDNMGKAVKGKGFKDLMTDLAKVLGPMVRSLGDIAGNIGTFLLEAFRDASPHIQTFLDWLTKVTQAWADFGKQGKGGKKSGLAKFFDDAVSSAKIVWGLIKNVAEAIGLLFAAGKGTGDSIFQSMSDAVGKVVTWLKDPANQKTLQTWFTDAKRLADKFGEILVSVVGFIDALDTPANREMLLLILDVINKIVKALTVAVTVWGEFKDAIIQATSGIDWSGIVNSILTWFSDLPGKIAGFFIGLGTKIIVAAGNLASSFATWISGVWATISAVPGRIVTFFSGLATKIITAAGNLASAFATWLIGLPAQAITVAGQIIVGFINLAGRMITAAGSIIGSFTQWLADLPGKAAQAAVNITVAFINLAIKIFQKAGSLAAAFGTWLAGVPGRMRTFAQSLPGYFAGLATKIIARAGSIASAFGSWLSALPGRARSAVVSIVSAFAGLAQKAIARAGSIVSAITSWLSGLPGKARSIVTQIANAFSGLAGKAIAKAGSIVSAMGRWASGVGARAAGVASDIVNAFRGLAGKIVDAIGTIIPKISMPHITIPHITAIVDVPKKAAGGVFTSPRVALFAEAGPEAVVPLNRPLSQVDPAVRMLSAFAQGKLPGMAGGGGRPGRTIDVGGITINTPTEDPRAVASEVVAHMAAASYI